MRVGAAYNGGMAYVDGFLIPVPKNKLAEYKAISRKAGKVWKEHGALEYRENVGDDLEHKGLASFVKAAGAKKDEVVVFSWIVFKSRAHRDKVNKKVMADARIAAMCTPGSAPFDVKRMAYGGFAGLVEV